MSEKPIGGMSNPYHGVQGGGDPSSPPYPPQYSTLPSAGGFYPPGPTVVTQTVMPATILTSVAFGPDPSNVTCPNCASQVRTTVDSSPGPGAYIAGAVMAFFGLICGCCLIPCCIDSMKVYTHSCPSCKALLGSYAGSSSMSQSKPLSVPAVRTAPALSIS